MNLVSKRNNSAEPLGYLILIPSEETDGKWFDPGVGLGHTSAILGGSEVDEHMTFEGDKELHSWSSKAASTLAPWHVAQPLGFLW